MDYQAFAEQGEFQILAKMAAEAEEKGEFETENMIDNILEAYNRCQLCGAEQVYDGEYYKRTGLWKCTQCN